MGTVIKRMRVAATGVGATGGGVMTFYTSDVTDVVSTAVQNLLTAFCAVVPVGTTFDVPRSGDTIDSATGNLNGTWTEPGTPVSISGIDGSNKWAAGVGARLVWNTPGIRRSRHVRGSTYLVPITSNGLDTSGTISDTWRTAMIAAAEAYLVAVDGAVIWSRPAPGASDGIISEITSVSMPDRVSWLRSRRT